MEQKIDEKKIDRFEFVKTLAAAIICATIIRSFFYEPFHIPSSSMYPNLMIGDYIFVSKFSYGYSRYSFPFGIKLFSGRIFESAPERGDVVVFRSPIEDSRSNGKEYLVKRIIGLPGDKIQIINGEVYINDQKVKKDYVSSFYDHDAAIAQVSIIKKFIEQLPDGKIINILDQIDDLPQDNTGIYQVPEGNYFMMGDNRDNSADSRFLTQMGYVPKENILGKATIIFFSTKDSLLKFWQWPSSIRFNRIFKHIE
jgi:signal peptidase I